MASPSVRGRRRKPVWIERRREREERRSGKETKIEMVWKFAFNYEIKGRGRSWPAVGNYTICTPVKTPGKKEKYGIYGIKIPWQCEIYVTLSWLTWAWPRPVIVGTPQ